MGLESTEGFRRMCRVSQFVRDADDERLPLTVEQAMTTASEPSYSHIISIRSLIIAGLKDAHAAPAVLHSLAASLHGTILSHAKDDLKVLLHYGRERMEERRWERETRIVTLEAGYVPHPRLRWSIADGAAEAGTGCRSSSLRRWH